MAGEQGKIALIGEDGVIQPTAERSAEIGATSPSGNLVITASTRNNSIDITDIPRAATTRVQLGTYEYGSSPVGWSPSEERLATIVNPSTEGELAVVVVEWRQRSVIRIPGPKGFHQSWQPITWLDEETFVIWFEEDIASFILGRNILPFLVRLPQPGERSPTGSRSPTVAIDYTNPNR